MQRLEHTSPGDKKVLGQEHYDTLVSMANLATTCGSQGQWKEAGELNMQVLETRKKGLGLEHSDTLSSMINLAQDRGRR